MSNLRAEQIEKPRHFKLAPLVAGRSGKPVVVLGFDSEAEKGRPILFQWSVSGTGEAETLLDKVKDGVAPHLVFLSRLDLLCTDRKKEYVIFGWNLSYEWTQLFGAGTIDIEDEMNLGCTLDMGGQARSRWTLNIANAKRYFGTIRKHALDHDESKRDRATITIRFLDGMAFYTTGLDKAGKILGLGRKLGLCGLEHESRECDACVRRKKNLSRADLDDPLFMAYARQDAYLTRRIGEQIIADHEAYDVRTCISAPHFAARVFRRHFLNAEIPLPVEDLENAGLASYHGGKNGYYMAGPKHMTGVYAFDITSAYPEAMRALPDIEQSMWTQCDGYQKGLHALWHVTGYFRQCRYRGLMAHDGSKLPSGYVEDLWITSYELDAVLEHHELDMATCTGWRLDGPPGGPLTRYVDTFFAKKNEAKKGGPAQLAAYQLAKLMLNSLYGKFFQKQPKGTVGEFEIDGNVNNMKFETIRLIKHDPDEPYDYEAGGLYHPPIASLITGYVRGKIHRLEHKYQAIMTSTDGFFSRRKPDPADLGSYLGGLTAAKGDLSIWRERLYIFRARAGSDDKFALHGFRGDRSALARVPLTNGAYSYRAQQMMTLRLAMHAWTDADGVRRRYLPGQFADLLFTLKLGP